VLRSAGKQVRTCRPIDSVPKELKTPAQPTCCTEGWLVLSVPVRLVLAPELEACEQQGRGKQWLKEGRYEHDTYMSWCVQQMLNESKDVQQSRLPSAVTQLQPLPGADAVSGTIGNKCRNSKFKRCFSTEPRAQPTSCCASRLVRPSSLLYVLLCVVCRWTRIGVVASTE
jgi:hypothetical protein